MTQDTSGRPATTSGHEPDSAIRWYDLNGEDVAPRYDSIDPEALYGWAVDLLPRWRGYTVLDIGAGTGRDGGWWRRRGGDVTAVEPSATMRRIARSAGRAADVEWVDDRLPHLREIRSRNREWVVVSAHAVLMHLPRADRLDAFRAIVDCMMPGGLLLTAIRSRGSDKAGRFHDWGVNETAELAAETGLTIIRSTGHGDIIDLLDRPDVRWTRTALLKPGT